MIDPSDDVTRIADAFAAGDDGEGRAALAGWLAADPARAELAARLDAARTALRGVGEAEVAEDVATLRRSLEAWAAAHPRPREAPAVDIATRRPRIAAPSRSVRRWGWSVAAGVAIVAGISLVARRAHRGDTPAAPERVYTTGAGQRATVTLADGSRAVLGPATTLRVSRQGARTLAAVRGEVLFDVAHAADRSFVVRTGRATTRVLGTTFVVRQYDADRATQVAVVDGRVAVRSLRSGNAGTQAVLVANAAAVVNDSGQVLVTPNVRADDYTSWTTGVLVFHNAPARQVLADLGRAYGVDFQLADSATADHPLNWTVTVDHQPLGEVLDGLALLLDVHVVRSGRTLVLKPGRAAARKSVTRPSNLIVEPAYGK